MIPRDPYGASLAVTLFFFYGVTAVLAWLAYRWPLAFAAGVLLFFLLIYGKLNFLVRPLCPKRRTAAPSSSGAAP